jgi:uncharacterized repeat protein (TIGR03803 family)
MKRISKASGELNRARGRCAVFGLYATMALALPAQAFTTLHNFISAGGAYPGAGLVEATNGDLYGATGYGGANGNYGTIFKISPAGAFTTLYSFCSHAACADGQDPSGALVQGANGDLYGTTSQGGATGLGTVFKITLDGQLTTLHNFCSPYSLLCADGAKPAAGLIQATNGDFYGTTRSGGAHGHGTIFQITPSGELAPVYPFCSLTNCADGGGPAAGLVQAANGDFYGTTAVGGTGNDGGTVFKITPGGSLTMLYSFCSQGASCPDGLSPHAGLVEAADGDFYGTTFEGGAHSGGTVFRITPSGTLSTIYSFCSLSRCMDGGNPEAGLIQAANGAFYGTAMNSGVHGGGNVFQITPSGQLTTIYSFCSQAQCTDGRFPHAGVVQAANGALYGTTMNGGAGGAGCSQGCGTVFSLY